MKHTVLFYLIKVSGVTKLIGTESKLVVARGWKEKGKRGYSGKGAIEFQFCKMKNSGDLLYNNVNIPNITESYLTLLNHTLKNGKDGKFYVYFTTIKIKLTNPYILGRMG